MDTIISIIVILIISYFSGNFFDKTHERSLRLREGKSWQMEALSIDPKFAPEQISVYDEFWLVYDNIVLAEDVLKYYLALRRGILGGTLKTHEGLLDRARREALQRLKDKASKGGAKALFNIRLETTNLTGFKNTSPSQVEVVAYATAVK